MRRNLTRGLTALLLAGFPLGSCAPREAAADAAADTAAEAAAAPVALPAVDEPRRLSVMFFGAPTANGPHHDPITRYRVLKKAFGAVGIDLTYREDPEGALRRDVLAAFDAVLLYGNWAQNAPMPREQLDALIGYVEAGGGFVPVHCASACWGRSPRFVRLVGARFQSHGGEEFQVENVAPDHEILQGLEGYRAWDETYVHDEHGDDRQILQVRDGEPWTWVRRQGEGRVFYTASGHDHRVWDMKPFQDLLRRAVLWAVGPDRAKLLDELGLPTLEQEAVSLPGYRQRREITEGQKPLSPAESKKLIQVAPGMDVQLFASEPDIVNPIHVAWDHRGRAFVLETLDYPNNLQAGNIGHDRITICEDTDGDGRADRFTRFAEGLSIPTSMCFANGGVVCTNGSEMLFLRDTDGDDVADERRVLFAGFNMGDTHAGPSNLRQGVDGFVYATIGYSGFRGEVGGVTHQFGQGVFRFRPDGSSLEFLQNTTNNTWGLGFTTAFDVVGSTANGNPSWYVTHPRAAYERADLEQPRTPAADDNPLFFPMSEDIRQVDQFDRYTAGAGHAVYTASRFPAEYQDRVAFVCGPTGKLVGSFELRRVGGGYRAVQWPNNLFCSADAWTSPVCAEVGPDGAVWVCDWYNLIVQHNPTPSRASAGVDAKTGKGNAYETPLRDQQHGRIWRVFPRGTADDAEPDLDPDAPASLLAGLDHPNQLWRLHAQRLLAERAARVPLGKSEFAALEQRLTRAPASIHALHLLAQTGGLTPGHLEASLRAADEGTRRAALRLAPAQVARQRYVVDGGIDAAGRELAEVLVRLAELPADEAIGAAVYATAVRLGSDLFSERALRDAWTMAARAHAAPVLAAAAADGRTADAPVAQENLLPNPGFEDVADGRPVGWTDLRHYSGAGPDRITFRAVDGGRNGSRCLEIQCSEFTDSGVAATVRLEPGSRYRLRGFVKTVGAQARPNTPGMMLNVHGGPRTRGLAGDQDWTELSVEFDAWQGEHVIHCLFGGYGGARGTALYDDLELVRIGSGMTLDGALRALAEVAARAGQEVEPVAKVHTPDAAVHARGLDVYRRTCIACHGFEGRGVPQVFPPLDGSDWITGDPELPIRIVLHGLQGPVRVGSGQYQNVMAPLGTTLDDAEIADVLTLVRQSWSNDAAPVTADQVRAVRTATAARTSMWTAAELGR